MREIKFRAWHTTEKIFWYFNLVTVRTSTLIDRDWFRLDPPQQYTGLKDKNGKEIYEGDVAITDLGHTVEIRWDFCTESTEEWDFEYTGFCMRNPKLQKNFHLDKGHVLTIIGNIHESPELLKQ